MSETGDLRRLLLTKAEVARNVEWLLSNASQPVKYLTHRDLLRDDPHSGSMRKLWTKVEGCSDVDEIFSKQEKDGSWCADGPWSLPAPYMPKAGYTPVSPKYVTTAWILPILGDMGFTTSDERIRRACEYVLSHQCRNGFIGETRDVERCDVRCQNPCRFAVTLVGLGKVGMGSDPRVRRACDLLVAAQRDDGGWAFQEHYRKRNWTRSCPWSSYHTALALRSSGLAAYNAALTRALRFLVWHLSTKEDDEIRRFFYHGHSTVHELVMLSELNVGLREKPVRTILEWLLTMYHPDEGRFRYIGKPVSMFSRHRDAMDARVAKYRLYHLIEDDWLTYYVTRIAVNLLGHRRRAAGEGAPSPRRRT